MKPLHSINELTFDFSFSTKKIAQREQENIQKWVVESLLVEVDQLFSQYSNSHKILRFDQLTIDVGSIGLQNYQEKISQKILIKLTSLISEQLSVVIPLENLSLPTAEPATDVILVQFIEFLFAGYVSRHNSVPIPSVHEALFAQVVNRLNIATFLRTLPDSNATVKRLAQQFSQVYLAEILQQLCPTRFESVFAFVDVIELTDFSSAISLEKKDVLNLLWEQLLSYFVTNKVNDISLSSWAKPLFLQFANTLNLTEQQLFILINETSQQHYAQIHRGLIAHLLADSILTQDAFRDANILAKPLILSVNNQCDDTSLEFSVSTATIQQIEFLLTNAFANANLDFILLHWQKIRSDYSAVALKAITYLMDNVDFRKKLVHQLPDAYLIDFVFLIQPQLLQFLLSLIRNAEQLYAVIGTYNESSRASFSNFKAWKKNLWEIFLSGLADQSHSTLDLKKYWHYLISELSTFNHQDYSIIEHQWFAILGDNFKRTVVHGTSIKNNSNLHRGENLRFTDQIENRMAMDNATAPIADYFDLTLLNEEQVHQLVSHAIAGVNIHFLVTHWDVLNVCFPDVLLNNLRHYFNGLELRQDIIANLPEALLLDTVKIINVDIYPIVSALIGNAEFLYRLNAQAYFDSKDEKNDSFAQWKMDIWQVCFNTLFTRFNAQNTPAFLILHLLESLSNMYHFDIQLVAPQWLSLCDGFLPASALSSFTEKKSSLFRFSELESSADDQYDSELVFVERYLFHFERSQKTLDILLSDLSVNKQAINRFYRHIELNYISLSSIQLSLNDWLALIQFYIGMQNREGAADLLSLVNKKVEQQELALDYCYQILARLLKSDKDSYKAVIENNNITVSDRSLSKFIALKDFARMPDEHVIEDGNVRGVERVFIDKSKPTDKNSLSNEYFPRNEKSVIHLISENSSAESKSNIPHFLKFEQQHNAVERELQSDKELLNALRSGSVQLGLLKLSSDSLTNIVVEFVETNTLYSASFKIDLLASIHNHANQASDACSFYTSVLSLLLAEQILDLEAIVNKVNSFDSSNVKAKENSESSNAISLSNPHQQNSESLFGLCEQLRSKSISITQVDADEADLWRLLVAYLESDKVIVNDFRADMLAAFTSKGHDIADRNSYYRKIISALIAGDILDLESFSASSDVLSVAKSAQSLPKHVDQIEINNSFASKVVFEQDLRDMSIDYRIKNSNQTFDYKDLIFLLEGPNELTSSQIIELQKIINCTLKNSGFSDDEWASVFLVKKMAEKFISYVPGHILHQLFLRLRPDAYQALDELVRIVLGALALLIPNINTHKIHQAKWLYIVELIFSSTDSGDEKVLLQKISYNLGAAAGIEDLQRLVNIVQRRRVLLRPVRHQQTQFSQEKVVDAIKRTVDSNALAVGLHINNVGLVLVAPYLPRLFSMLELIKDGEFIHSNAADRAVHLLQYIVTGQSQTVEYELVLNKILCGISTSIPISSGIEITDQEKASVEQMLTSIIQHWNVLGSTSITGLRETFFQRQGWLRLQDDAWHIDVNEGTFDMLIDHIPWSFSLIKYGWMDKPLHVKWRSKD